MAMKVVLPFEEAVLFRDLEEAADNMGSWISASMEPGGEHVPGAAYLKDANAFLTAINNLQNYYQRNPK